MLLAFAGTKPLLTIPTSSNGLYSVTIIPEATSGQQRLNKENLGPQRVAEVIYAQARMPAFICEYRGGNHLGYYSFVGIDGSIRSQFQVKKDHVRKEGLYFLLRLFLHASTKSVFGSGQILIPNKFGNIFIEDVGRGYTRGNKVYKELSGCHLGQLGVACAGRREAFTDSYGMSYPTYNYNLTLPLVLIKHQIT